MGGFFQETVGGPKDRRLKGKENVLEDGQSPVRKDWVRLVEKAIG